MKEMKIPSVALQGTEARKRRKETIKTKIGEVVDRREALEAVVKLIPVTQKIRLMKVPSRARPIKGHTGRGLIRQSCSLRRKMGNMATVEIKVRMAAKLRGGDFAKSDLGEEIIRPPENGSQRQVEVGERSCRWHDTTSHWLLATSLDRASGTIRLAVMSNP